MGWNTIIKSEKGILSGQSFISGDITGNITFSNNTDNVNIIPNVSQDDQNHRIQEYIGWMPDNSFNWIVSNLNTTHKLVAAFRLTAIDPLNINAGTFLCAKMWARDIQNTENRKSAYVGCEWSKRVYIDEISYTETYPLGTYWPDNEINFTPSAEFPARSAETIAIFLKTGFFNIEKNVVGGFAIGWRNGYASCYGSGKAWRAKYSWFKSASGFGTDADIPEGDYESQEFGQGATPKGGYADSATHGTFDDTSDKITYSSKPTMHAGMSGFFHAYFVTQSQLQNIGKAIFPQAQSSYSDIIDAMAGVVTSIWNSKKVDCLVDCLVLPISVPFGTETNIQCGGGELIYFDGATWQNIKGFPVSDYYVDVDCGTLELDEYWCNFLDFSGTRIKIFLPYIGFVDLQPEYINGGGINVKYRFNVIDGSFMCVLHSTSGKSNLEESLIGQYSGMACLHIPITSQNYSQQISGLISSSGMAVTAGLTGNAGMAFGSAMNLANTLAQKPSTAHNNGYNSSSSFLSHRKPYLIIERQVAQFSPQYPQEDGLPSYVSKPLSQIHGFTILDNPVLNIDCNDEEYTEIISLLKTGVIF